MLKRWLLLALIAVIVCSVIAAAQDDDDTDEEPEGSAGDGRNVQHVADGIDAEEAAEEIDEDTESKDEGDSSGVKAHAFFPKYADLKVPAGERIEILIPITNAPANPSYEVALIAGHIALLDHSRYIQNFSAQVYNRVVEAGETATIKYTVTPDALLEPMDYAFVVAAYLRTDNNQTIIVPAFNGTMLVTDPLGFDFKGLFTMVAFLGAIGGGAYHFINKKQASRPAPRGRSTTSAATVETGTKDSAYDPEFIDKSHLAYIQSGKKADGRNRSASK